MLRQKCSKFLVVWLCAMCLVLGSGFPGMPSISTAHAADAVLTVDAGVVVAPMKKEMRGTNIGLWTRNEFHPVSNRTERYVNLIKEAGISLIRFPAGAEADLVYWDRTNSYEWHVGPSPYTRTVTASIFDSFMSLVQEVGAEAMITVNAKINNKEMAADMVRYANIEKGYNIKYWEIGNEPEFYRDAYAVTPEAFAIRIQEYTEAMKAVDPSIKIIGPANAQPSQFENWTKPILSVLAGNNKPVDSISVHWYPLWGGQTNTNSSSYATIDNLLAYEGPDWPNSYISWANQFTDTTPNDNLVSYRDQYAPGALIGITEMGQVTGGSEGAGIGDTMAGALWMGDVLGRLAYHQVDYVTQFLLQGNQAYGLMDMNKNVRPAYYVYPLLKRHFGDQMVETSSSDNQNLTIWASKRTGADGKLYMMVVNKNQTQDMSATIDLSNFTPQWNASAWVLNAPAIDSVSGANINGVQVATDGTLGDIPGHTITGVSDSFTRTFPAHSITMIELTEAGTTTKTPAQYLGQYADGMNERRTAANWPGNPTDTPEGWGKIWRTATGSWTVNFPETGEYEFTVRAYGEGGAPSFQVKLDGQSIPNASFSPGNKWSDYQGSLGTVTAGTHTVEIQNISSVTNNNIDVAHIEIIGAAPGLFHLASPADQSVLDSDSVTLDWTQSVDGRSFAPFGADHYTLIVADNQALNSPIIHRSVTSTTQQISQLKGDTTYYWSVTAANANGATQAEEIYSFTTPYIPLPDTPARYLGQFADGMNERKTASNWPGNPTDTPEGWGKIWRTATAQWSANFAMDGEYTFTVRAYGEGEAPSFQVKIDGKVIPNASFSPGSSWGDYQGSLGSVSAGTHMIQITNTSAVAQNNIDVAHIEINGAAPGSFSLMSPAQESTVSSTMVLLDWTQVVAGKSYAPFAADDYRVIVANNAELTNPIIDQVVTTTSHFAEGLQNNTTYYWNVMANNANGLTSANDVFSFTTPSISVPDHPARYLGQYADNMNERRTAATPPGNATDTPEGWGKIWRTGEAWWHVHFPETGVYEFTIKAYGEGEAPSFQVKLDGQDVPNGFFPAGNSWTDYHGRVGVTAGTHILEIHNNSTVPLNNIAVAHMDVFGAAPGHFTLMSPANQATVNTSAPILDWTQIVAGKSYAPFAAEEYTLTVADNAELTQPILVTTVEDTSYQVSGMLDNTTYYWSVTAVNANGSTTADTIFSFNTVLDEKAPVSEAAVTGDKAGNWYRSDVVITLTAEDEASGIASIQYRTQDEAAWSVYDQPIVLQEEGVHTIEYRSIDLADNVEVPQLLEISIDKSAPSWLITTGGVSLQDVDVFQDNQEISFEWIVSDELSGVDGASLTLDGISYEAGEVIDLFGQLGEHVVGIEVSDHAGNLTTASIRFTVEMTISVDALAKRLERYEQSGDLAGPLLAQLIQTLATVEHHLTKGDEDKAAKHMDKFLKHLENPALNEHVTEEAIAVLTVAAEAQIEEWITVE
jgi:hypothetical protein